MQNPFKEWVFPEIVSVMEDQLRDGQDIMALIVQEHVQLMSENKFLEAYDWDQITNELLNKLHVDAEIDVTSLVMKHATTPKVFLLEDTMLDSLRKIKEKGYKIAAATNGYHKYQYPVLQCLKLDTVFDEVITSDMAGCAKPDPLILQSIVNKGKVIAHVGDRIDHDVVMANRSDILSILIHKNVSTDILDLPIDQRKNHPSFLSFCEEKWYRENELRKQSFQKTLCLPDIVVCSIEELAKHMDSIITT